MSLIPEFGSTAFVVLPPATKKDFILFAKNSERPTGEVQEVIYVAGEEHPAGSKVKCTYIEVDQVSKTNAILLSKPAWMWGGEMGSNSKGVCIGLTATKTKLLEKEGKEKRLLGHDLLRLSLERSESAEGATKVITSLLEEHGQGGSWKDEDDEDCIYHTNFLIVDRKEAWILETAGKVWVSKRYTSCAHSTSACLTIDASYDNNSSSLQEQAQSLSAPSGDVNFAEVFGDGRTCDRLKSGLAFLNDRTGAIDIRLMMDLLRNPKLGSSTAASSMVSVIPLDPSLPCFHLVTGTPNTEQSIFKPFVFAKNDFFSESTVSPEKTKEGSKHELYRLHETAQEKGILKDGVFTETMRGIEDQGLVFIDEIYNGKEHLESDLEGFFSMCVEMEMKFYV